MADHHTTQDRAFQVRVKVMARSSHKTGQSLPGKG